MAVIVVFNDDQTFNFAMTPFQFEFFTEEVLLALIKPPLGYLSVVCHVC
jgi:hypothetical protein